MLIESGGLKAETLKRRKLYVDSLEDFLQEKGLNPLSDLVAMPGALQDALLAFFNGLKKNDGTLMSSSYLNCFKSHIHMHICAITEGAVDITGPQFSKLGLLFKGLKREQKQEGKGDIVHHK